MINAYSRDTMILKRLDSTDSFNTPTFKPDITLKCRIERKTTFLKTDESQNVESKMMIYFHNRELTKLEDRVIIDGVEYSILKLDKLRSFYSGGHYQIWV